MVKILRIFLGIALWTPCLYWGDYISHKDGRFSFGDASGWESAIFWALAIAPYFVIVNFKKIGGGD